MTDASPDWDELRRKAEAVIAEGGFKTITAHRGLTAEEDRYHDAANPATILALLDERAALLDRAEKAEAEAKSLREALTPSGETKAAYIGEFSFRYKVGVDEYGEVLSIDNVSVPWTTIKEIMAAIRARALTGGDHG